MDNQIVFSPADMIALIKSICYLIAAVAAAAGAISVLINKLRAPDRGRDKRIEECEKRIDEATEKIEKLSLYVHRDFVRFEELEKSNKVFQRGILALVNHSIDGNNVEELKAVSDEIKKDIFDVKG